MLETQVPPEPDMGAYPDVFAIHTGFTPPAYHVDIYDYFAGILVGLLDAPPKKVNRASAVITFNYDGPSGFGVGDPNGLWLSF
jgi:hypothetical protein